MPRLEVCPSVIDFGNLVCEHQITSQQLTLTNTGSKQGKFIFLVDQLPSLFKVSPTKVTLSPGEAVHVKVTSIILGICFNFIQIGGASPIDEQGVYSCCCVEGNSRGAL